MRRWTPVTLMRELDDFMVERDMSDGLMTVDELRHVLREAIVDHAIDKSRKPNPKKKKETSGDAGTN